MKIVCKVQEHLVLAYRKRDSGEFFFVLCREGLEEALGRKLEVREECIIDIMVRDVKSKQE